MKRRNKYNNLLISLFFSLFSLAACDKQTEVVEGKKIMSVATEIKISAQKNKPLADKIIIENKSYLFDIAKHSMDEFRALLTKVEEASQNQDDDYPDLKIVMVIHGPDIKWFTLENYEDNRQLIDLAARLDAYDLIDMKVCEKTMSYSGIDRKNIPAFIESVPYGPAEIKHRLRDGYINL